MVKIPWIRFFLPPPALPPAWISLLRFMKSLEADIFPFSLPRD